MKFNFMNLLGGVIFLLLGFLSIGDTTLSNHNITVAMEWWVPYTFIVAGLMILGGEINASRKRK